MFQVETYSSSLNLPHSLHIMHIGLSYVTIHIRSTNALSDNIVEINWYITKSDVSKREIIFYKINNVY